MNNPKKKALDYVTKSELELTPKVKPTIIFTKIKDPKKTPGSRYA